MSKTILFLSLISSSVAFATVSDKTLAAKCLDQGIAKIATQAEAYNCAADFSSVVVSGVDNRFYNPSKYIWYKANVTCQDASKAEVQTLVQYNSFTRKCL